MKTFKDLLAYRKAFEMSMDIYQLSKSFPLEEKYSLTDQIRRSSRSICSNIAEGYRKKRYPAHFISKLTDADSENAETAVWLDFAFACQYLPHEQHSHLLGLTEEIGKLLGYMIQHPENFCTNRI